MKTFFAPPNRPLKTSEAWTLVLLNLFATPGLGTLLARRFISGAAQLGFACLGFFLVMAWFLQKMRVFYGQIFGTDLPVDSGTRFGMWGLICFAVAWIWALVTSIFILRGAREPGPAHLPPPIPE